MCLKFLSEAHILGLAAILDFVGPPFWEKFWCENFEIHTKHVLGVDLNMVWFSAQYNNYCGLSDK